MEEPGTTEFSNARQGASLALFLGSYLSCAVPRPVVLTTISSAADIPSLFHVVSHINMGVLQESVTKQNFERVWLRAGGYLSLADNFIQCSVHVEGYGV